MPRCKHNSMNYQGKVERGLLHGKVRALGCKPENLKWYINNNSNDNFKFHYSFRKDKEDVTEWEDVSFLKVDTKKKHLDIYVYIYKRKSGTTDECDNVRIPGLGYRKLNCRKVPIKYKNKSGTKKLCSVNYTKLEQKDCCLKVWVDQDQMRQRMIEAVVKQKKLMGWKMEFFSVYNLMEGPIYLYYVDLTDTYYDNKDNKSCRDRFNVVETLKF